MQGGDILTFDIRRATTPSESFRVAQIRGNFSYEQPQVEERFSGELDLRAPWHIGLIHGASGTGKSTIARELFGEPYAPQYGAASVVDDFPAALSIRDITGLFNSVGFSTVPSWLKPYAVLSTGERMRVDLARALAEAGDLVVFDEFTSVVDREVARFGSMAVARAVRRLGKRFVAVSCHDDVIDWLTPDWVLCTDVMAFKRRRLRRPDIRVAIHKERGRWPLFKRYHYLTADLNRTAEQYVGYVRDRPIAFCAVLHFPHAHNARIKKIHRIVVLPTYQGCGIGMRFQEAIAARYAARGFDVRIQTSQIYYAQAHLRRPCWRLVDKGIHRRSRSKSIPGMGRTNAGDRVLYSLRYIATG